jgi:dTDP-4-dehydrorhamnose reductase
MADAIIAVARNLLRSEAAELRGTFHMAGRGEASWADFAEAIFAASAAAGGASAAVKRISTAEYPTAAARPKNSRLDSTKLERVHGVSLREWRQPTKEVVARLCALACVRSSYA